MNLTEFLMQNPVDNIVEEVKIPIKRSNKSQVWNFKIKAITGEEFNNYQKQCNQIKKHGKMEFDNKKFNELIIINHTLEPNFKNADNIKKMELVTSEQFLYKTLLAGEIVELSQQILTLSGFDKDLDELKQEAKNS